MPLKSFQACLMKVQVKVIIIKKTASESIDFQDFYEHLNFSLSFESILINAETTTTPTFTLEKKS